jgi:DNA-binding beta-propeller fold protein YncE
VSTVFVSFHGGSSASSVNNIIGFPDGGSPYSVLGPSTTPAFGVLPALSELRAFMLSKGGEHLYVANGSKNTSQVLRFRAPSTPGSSWTFDDVYADKGLSHPFDLTIGFDDQLYVSNQDTNTVTAYSGHHGEPSTFVGGLSKVRGIAYDGQHLYVADAAAGTVTAYDSAAKSVVTFQVKSPVHLLYDGSRWLYVGSESDNSVIACDTHHVKSAKTVDVITGSTGIDHTAGLAIMEGGDGSTVTMFVASRKGRQVLAYPLDLSSGVPTWKPATSEVILDSKVLADYPEFVAVGSL